MTSLTTERQVKLFFGCFNQACIQGLPGEVQDLIWENRVNGLPYSQELTTFSVKGYSRFHNNFEISGYYESLYEFFNALKDELDNIKFSELDFRIAGRIVIPRNNNKFFLRTRIELVGFTMECSYLGKFDERPIWNFYFGHNQASRKASQPLLPDEVFLKKVGEIKNETSKG
jgi:hypothetical protein